MRMNFLSSQGRSTLYGSRKKDLDGRTTTKGTLKKLKTKVKWCIMNLGKGKKTRKRNPSSKKKGLMTTWEDLDLSLSEDEDEEGNLCLMTDTTSKDEDDEEVTFNDLNCLQIAYQELFSNSSTLSIGYKELKKKISKLSKEFDSLKKENDILKKDNEKLKEEQNQDLTKINTSELLKYNRHPHNKSGLGFDNKKEIKRDKSKVHCLNCKKFGHMFYDCRECLKRLFKPSRTNKKGPKNI
ncbi:hypothetical protein CR513_54401, partial [Mucuna pruriens]